MRKFNLKSILVLNLICIIISTTCILANEPMEMEETIVTAKRYQYYNRYFYKFYDSDFNNINNATIYQNGMEGFLLQPKLGGLPAYYFKVPLIAASLNNFVEGSVNLSVLPPDLRNVKEHKPFSINNSVRANFDNQYFDKDILLRLKGGTYKRKDLGVYIQDNQPNYMLDILGYYETTGGHVPNTDIQNQYVWTELNTRNICYIFGFSYSKNGYFEFTDFGFKSRRSNELIYNSISYSYDIPYDIKITSVFDIKKFSETSRRLKISDDTELTFSREDDLSFNLKNLIFKKFETHSHLLELSADRNYMEYTDYDKYTDEKYTVSIKSDFKLYEDLKISTNLGLKKQKHLHNAVPYKLEVFYKYLGFTLSRDYVDLPMGYRYFETASRQPNPDLKGENFLSKGIILKVSSDLLDIKLETGKMDRENPVYWKNIGNNVFMPDNGEKWQTDYLRGNILFTVLKVENKIDFRYLKSIDDNNKEVKDEIKLDIDYGLSYSYGSPEPEGSIYLLMNYVNYNSTPDKKAEHKNIVFNLYKKFYFSNSYIQLEALNLTDEKRQVWYFFPQPGRRINLSYNLFI